MSWDGTRNVSGPSKDYKEERGPTFMRGLKATFGSKGKAVWKQVPSGYGYDLVSESDGKVLLNNYSKGRDGTKDRKLLSLKGTYNFDENPPEEGGRRLRKRTLKNKYKKNKTRRR